MKNVYLLLLQQQHHHLYSPRLAMRLPATHSFHSTILKRCSTRTTSSLFQQPKSRSFIHSRPSSQGRNHSVSHSHRFRTKLLTASIGVTGVAGAIAYFLWTSQQQQNEQPQKNFNYYKTALFRNLSAGWTIAQVVWDYEWTLRSKPDDPYLDPTKPFDPAAEILIRPLSPEQEAYNELKSQVHLRSAKRLLELFRRNGGIYVKLGQHLAAMEYLLPREYTETMKELQDQCTPTPLQDVKSMFKNDMGIELEDLFSEFDPEPLGVASLAQVHRAKMKTSFSQSTTLHENHTNALLEVIPVAVKIQHPYLRDYADMDIKTCAFFVRVVKSLFPQFQFDWLADEMQKSLPQEMDFVHEAQNTQRVSKMFENDPVVHIPKVYLAKPRVLVMEYINGARIDDLQYIEKHQIPIADLSHQLTIMFCKMIFTHGFVHCDPHPANCFIRSISDKKSFLERILDKAFLWRWIFGRPNFQIVLLDHGLYRTLSKTFRWDYANFWYSILQGNEARIEHYAYRLFLHDKRVSVGGIDHHRLFASMITGRAWEAISSHNVSKSNSKSKDTLNPMNDLSTFLGGLNTGLSRARSEKEMITVKTKLVKSVFLEAIADILAKLPRELLLLLKTHDLLRSIESSLGLTTRENQKIVINNMLLMMWYTGMSMYSVSSPSRSGGEYHPVKIDTHSVSLDPPIISDLSHEPQDEDVGDLTVGLGSFRWTDPSEWSRMRSIINFSVFYYLLLGIVYLIPMSTLASDEDMAPQKA